MTRYILTVAVLCLAQLSFSATDCSTLPPWNSLHAYTGDDRVQFQGEVYTARWWTQGDAPGTDQQPWNAWQKTDRCIASTTAKPPTANSESKAVSIFQHCNYTGWSASLAEGTYTLSQLNDLGFVNDEASSIQVAPGYAVDVYQHDYFNGDIKTFDANDDCFVNEGFNDTVSSIVVRSTSNSSSRADFGK